MRVRSQDARKTVVAPSPQIVSPRELCFFLLSAVLGLGCQRNLSLPPEPPPPSVPSISGFTPRAAFAGDRLVVYGANFTDGGNLLLFGGGFTQFASLLPDGGGEERIDGGLVFFVPSGLDLTEPLVLSNSSGRSDPSAESFVPLGSGHPTVGAPVGSVRFRHAPVGILDRTENVLLASGLFDLVLTDGKAFERMPGKPLALERSPNEDAGLVAIRTEDGMGLLMEVDDGDGHELQRSSPQSEVPLFILPTSDPLGIARTIGRNEAGEFFLSEWGSDGGVLEATTRQLPFSDVLGAAADDSLLIVVARGLTAAEANAGVYSVETTAVPRVWDPKNNPACLLDDSHTLCEPPDGPVAIIPAPSGPPQIAVSLSSGDLLVLGNDAGTFVGRDVTLISYAPIDDLKAGLAPNKAVLTKARDGALFQYDLTGPMADTLEWSVQLRGEPTKIAFAPAIDEIAVANRADNSVDTVDALSGTWSGRIAFDLGLGAAPNHQGGIVPTYSYDPDRYDGGVPPHNNLDLLMRNIGLVLSIDASSLELRGYTVLDTSKREALRLAVTQQFETLVIHREGIGLLEDNPDGGPRRERIVTTIDPGLVTNVFAMPNGELVFSTLGTIRVFTWINTSEGRKLSQRSEFTVAPGSTLDAIHPVNDDVLVVTHSGGTYDASIYPTARLRAGGTPTSTMPLPNDKGLGRLVGIVTHAEDGPTLFFGTSNEGPLACTMAGDAPSLISRSAISGPAPDRRFVVWIDEQAPEPTVRLMTQFDGTWDTYSTYRFGAAPAGPDFDPSGQWLYLPLTRLDELEVVQ
ncbi:MAG: hypothetical protein JNM17_24365 [Archangium sp.]|nr:hypothetical protein [Archangium sp.]